MNAVLSLSDIWQKATPIIQQMGFMETLRRRWKLLAIYIWLCRLLVCGRGIQEESWSRKTSETGQMPRSSGGRHLDVLLTDVVDFRWENTMHLCTSHRQPQQTVDFLSVKYRLEIPAPRQSPEGLAFAKKLKIVQKHTPYMPCQDIPTGEAVWSKVLKTVAFLKNLNTKYDYMSKLVTINVSWWLSTLRNQSPKHVIMMVSCISTSLAWWLIFSDCREMLIKGRAIIDRNGNISSNCVFCLQLPYQNRKDAAVECHIRVKKHKKKA